MSPPPAQTTNTTKASVQGIVLTDGNHNKLLPVTVVYPSPPSPKLPCIIFSHGATGAPIGYLQLAKYWAKHGYVVLMPVHADSCVLDGQMSRTLGVPERVREVIGQPENWVTRVQDAIFLMDSLAQIEEEVPDLKGKLDRTRIGMGGHSFGAHTSEVIAGATMSIPSQPKPVSLTDSRPKAFLLMSPPGIAILGLKEDSWSKMSRPFLVMTGTRDLGMEAQPVEWREEVFKKAPPGNKYLAVIRGATHMSFADQILLQQLMQKEDGGPHGISAWVASISLAFWDAYLKSDKQAMSYLQPKQISQLSHGLVTMATR
jgi:predicted dienelactone hydrolase